MDKVKEIMELVLELGKTCEQYGAERDADKGFHANYLEKTIEAALRELLESQQKDQVDAECFRWWVHEAEANPVLVAKSISHCVTEDEYRLVICGAMQDAKAAIKMAKKG